MFLLVSFLFVLCMMTLSPLRPLSFFFVFRFQDYDHIFLSSNYHHSFLFRFSSSLFVEIAIIRNHSFSRNLVHDKNLILTRINIFSTIHNRRFFLTNISVLEAKQRETKAKPTDLEDPNSLFKQSKKEQKKRSRNDEESNFDINKERE